MGIAGLLQPGHGYGGEGFVDLYQVDVLQFHAGFFHGVGGGRNGGGEHPDGVLGAHAHVRDTGAGREVVALEGIFGHDQHGGGGVAGLAGYGGGDGAAFHQGLEFCHFFHGGVAWGLVHFYAVEGCDFEVETAVVDGFERAGVGFQGEGFHLLPGDFPLVGDHLGGVELGHGDVAVARHPALAAGEGIAEAQGLGRQHGGGNRDPGHGLYAAGNHHIVDPGHDGLGGEVHGLLGGAALAVDGGAGHFVGQAGGEPAGSGYIASQWADRVDTAKHNVVVIHIGDAVARHQGFDHVSAKVSGVHIG